MSSLEDTRSWSGCSGQRKFEALDVVVILKIHPMQAEKNIFKKKLSHIIFVQDKDLVKWGLQLYQIVGKTDALLTDYSSISTDYILLDKPMGFVIYDIDNYRASCVISLRRC